MPKTEVHYEQVVGVRLPSADVKKLDRLARTTFRKRSDVVRLLLHLAEARDRPDLFLGAIAVTDMPGDEAHDQEAVGVAG